MILPIEIQKDTYVTDRNIGRTDGAYANFGRASTLDIFKLYNENDNGKYTSYFYPTNINGTNIFDNIQINIELDGVKYVSVKFITENLENFTLGSNIPGEDTIGSPIGAIGSRYDINTILNIFCQTCENIGSVTQDGPSGNITGKISCAYDNVESIVFIKTNDTHKEAKLTITNNNLNILSYEDFSCVEKSYCFIRPDFEKLLSKNISSSAVVKAELLLRSVNLGNTSPEAVDISCWEMLKDFDEGYGTDVNTMSDPGYCNFVTLQKNSDGTTTDFLVPCELTTGHEVGDEFFTTTSIKNEDLSIDVTESIISLLDNFALGDIVSHKGFAVGISSEMIIDKNTYFVRRFASRHVSNLILRPTLVLHLKDSIKKSSIKTFDSQNNFETSVKGIDTFIDNNNVYQVFCRGSISRYNDQTMLYEDYILFDRQMVEKTDTYGNIMDHHLVVSSISTDVSRFDENILNNIVNNELKVDITIYGIKNDKEFVIEKDEVYYRSIKTLDSLDRLYVVITGNSSEIKFASDDIMTFSVSLIDRDEKYTATRKKMSRTSVNVGDMYYSVKDIATGKYFIEGVSDANRLYFDGEKYVFDFYSSKILKDREIQFELIVDNGSGTIHKIVNEALKMRLR